MNKIKTNPSHELNDKLFEYWTKFKHLRTMSTYQNWMYQESTKRFNSGNSYDHFLQNHLS